MTDVLTQGAWGYGLATIAEPDDRVLDTWYPDPQLGSDPPGPESRRRALAVAALCVGGMAVARAIDDATFAREIRTAAKETALALGGWNKRLVAAE